MSFLKKYGVLLIFTGLFIVIGVVSLFPKTLQTGSWGLHFGAEGQAPTGNAAAQALKKYGAAFMGEPEKVLYLTFDAGYENGCTEKILDILRKKQVPAAFFLVGSYMERNPELVRKMADDGHIVGNHTQNHPDMSKIEDEAAFTGELTAVEETFRSITGRELPRFYRPPQGIYSEKNLEFAQKMGYKTVFWSLAYVDWQNDAQPSREQALSKLLPRTHDGAVVLLHSTSRTNAAILGELLDAWRDMGYRFGTLEELFAL